MNKSRQRRLTLKMNWSPKDGQSDSDLELVGLDDFMKSGKGRRIFLAAAAIVAVLTTRAADAASLEAGRKAASAALAKKKVLEALKYLSDAHNNENSREIQADEGASMPVTELGPNNYSSHKLGAGHGRGSRGRGHAAGDSSRGRGVGRGRGRGRGKVHGVGAGGSSRGHGASDSDSHTDTDSDYNPGNSREHGASESDSETNTDTDSDYDLGADSVSDYVGSSRRCKRKHPS